MNTLLRLARHRTFLRINLPVALLLALLQRTPLVRLLFAAENAVSAPSVAAVLRAWGLTAASLGGVHSLAGATVLAASQAAPVSATVGTPITPVGFTVTNTINIGSWRITGSIPPGLRISATQGGTPLTAPGVLDATTPGIDDGYGAVTGGIITTTPTLTGTPTAAGAYTITLQAFEFGGLRGLASGSFNYTINVTAAASASPPTLTTQPTSQSVSPGASVTLTAVAAGTGPFTYQWRKDGVAIAGATNATLTVAGVQAANAGNYDVVVTNAGGSTTSTVAALTLAISPPSITTQPASQSLSAGANVTLTAVATGTGPFTYQWRKDGVAIAGATSSTLALTNVQATNSGNYDVVVTNSAGSTTSTVAALSIVTAGPTVTAQPSSQIVKLGAAANLSVAASGTGPFTYQWRKDGVNIPGATSATLTIASAQLAHAGNYDVLITNSSGVTTSTAAVLNVGPTNRISNVSVRTTLQANQVLIVGVTMQGGSKPTLIRSVGPSLAAYGVTGAMADPRLQLFSAAGVEISANDNWSGDSNLLSTMGAVGAFPLAAATSLDAALVRSIDGGHTVQVSGPAAGNVLVEAYDAGSGNDARLINVSARNFVGSGADVMIAGFSLAGTGRKNILIRAVGPSLGQYGVTSLLEDPKVEIFDGNGVKVAENNDYASTLSAVFASVGAFALLPGSKDAAFIANLPSPGSYTAQVSGANGGTGNAIIELYELP